MISFNKPNKNIRILDGFKFNFLMHKKIAIEIRLGAALLKTGKKPSDFSKFIKRNKNIKNIQLIDNLYKI